MEKEMSVLMYTKRHLGIYGRHLLQFLLRETSAPKRTMICSINFLVSAGDFADEAMARKGLAALRRLGLLAYRESKEVVFMRLLVSKDLTKESDEAVSARN